MNSSQPSSRNFPKLRALALCLCAAGALATAGFAASAPASVPAASRISRSPGFSTRAGECLETVHAALAAQAAAGTSPDQDAQASYIAHEEAVTSLLRTTNQR